MPFFRDFDENHQESKARKTCDIEGEWLCGLENFKMAIIHKRNMKFYLSRTSPETASQSLDVDKKQWHSEFQTCFCKDNSEIEYNGQGGRDRKWQLPTLTRKRTTYIFEEVFILFEVRIIYLDEFHHLQILREINFVNFLSLKYLLLHSVEIS